MRRTPTYTYFKKKIPGDTFNLIVYKMQGKGGEGGPKHDVAALNQKHYSFYFPNSSMVGGGGVSLFLIIVMKIFASLIQTFWNF